MATPQEQAVALKNEGNKAFAAHNFLSAIEFYTKAIDLNDQEPTYFANRAQVRLVTQDYPPGFARVTDAFGLLQANIKSEAYGYAIADATKAIELNPKFVKVRRVPISSLQTRGVLNPCRRTSVAASRIRLF